MTVLLHRCQFVPFSSGSISQMIYDPNSHHLAICRSNGDIDIFTVHHNVDPVTTPRIAPLVRIPTAGFHRVVQCIAFGHSSNHQSAHLICGTLSGHLLQWDLLSMTMISSIDLHGGAIWCLAISPTSSLSEGAVAAGCSDGSVRLVKHNADPVVFKHYLGSEDRFLSLTFTNSFQLLVGTTISGTLLIWDVQTGALKHSISTSSESNKDEPIWSVHAINDHLVATAHGNGRVCIWDALLGTIISVFYTHDQCDVFALTSNHQFLKNDPTIAATICASGADGSTRLLRQSNADPSSPWIMQERYSRHQHDVRAACFVTSTLHLTAGVDTRIGLANIASKQSMHNRSLLKFNSIESDTPRQTVAVTRNANLLLASMSENSALGLWSLGTKQMMMMMEDDAVVVKDPCFDFQINVPGQGTTVSAFAINSTGSELCYATRAHGVFRVVLTSQSSSSSSGDDDEKLLLQSVQVSNCRALDLGELTLLPTLTMQYHPTMDGRIAIGGAASGSSSTHHCIAIATSNSKEDQVTVISLDGSSSPARLLEWCPFDANLLLAENLQGQLFLLAMDQQTVVCSLQTTVPSQSLLWLSNSRLLITDSLNKVFLVDFSTANENQPTLRLLKDLGDKDLIIGSILSDAATHRVALWTRNAVYFFHMDDTSFDQKDIEITEHVEYDGIRAICKTSGDLVMVERPWHRHTSTQLPMVVSRKRFGGY